MIAAAVVLFAQLALPAQRPDSASHPPAIVTRARLDTSAAVNFRVLVVPDTVYVGQQVVYQLGVFLDSRVRDRLRRMEAIAPEMRGMMAYDPPAPVGGFPPRTVAGRSYEAHVYQRAIFPLTAGRLVIPPARLVYSLPLSYSFFSREESYEVRSDSAVVVAIEPPRASRPPDWAGAVGSLRVSARVDTAIARVGDPVLLTVRVVGRGNVKLFPRPRLEVAWASTVPAGERVMLSSDSLDVHGAKEFDWVLTPRMPGRRILPALRYPYFDPATRRYDVATTAPLALEIGPGSLALTDTGTVARPRWALRPTFRGALAREPYTQPPFWWVMMVAPLPAVVLLARRRPRRRRPPPPPARTLQALAHRERAPAADVRRAFLSAVSARLRVPATALAEPAALARAARRAGAPASTASAAAALLEALNAAAFSRDGTDAHDLAARAHDVYQQIDAGARTFRRVTPAVIVAMTAGALAVGAVVHAAAPNPDALLFARGVEAYARGQFRLSMREFATIAARTPRAADAWANLGTAAFAAADTGRAVLGWQRALRLEPLATDVRERLDVLGASAGSGHGAVPAIPPIPLAVLAGLLWTGGWLAIAWRSARRTPAGVSPLAAGAVAAALALGAATAVLDAQLAARDLGVAAREMPLRLIPALAAERTTTVRAGDVVRITERDGQWAHVVADGGRDGWAERAALYSIARD